MINEKNKALGIHPSVIRNLYEYANKRKKEIGEDKVFDYSLGNPSSKTPKEVNDILISLINDEENVHSYTSSNGLEETRIAVKEYLEKTYHTTLNADYIFITSGAAPALSIAANALTIRDNHDEAIVFAPHFPDYRVFCENAGASLVTVQPDPKTFLPDFNDFEKKINEHTKFVIYNSPLNPTGVVYKEDTILRLTSILKKKELEYNHPIYLISDEPYRELIYDDIKYPFITNYYDNSIVCYSFSKCLSLPGERIGYLVVNPKCYDAASLFYAIRGAAWSLGYICAPSLFQRMIPLTLGLTSDLNYYRINRDLLYQNLIKIGYDVIYPDGAFYIFVKALEPDAIQFSETAKKFELILVPSDSFDYPGYVRLAYCVKKEVIEASIKAFKQLFDYYKDK